MGPLPYQPIYSVFSLKAVTWIVTPIRKTTQGQRRRRIVSSGRQARPRPQAVLCCAPALSGLPSLANCGSGGP